MEILIAWREAGIVRDFIKILLTIISMFYIPSRLRILAIHYTCEIHTNFLNESNNMLV